MSSGTNASSSRRTHGFRSPLPGGTRGRLPSPAGCRQPSAACGRRAPRQPGRPVRGRGAGRPSAVGVTAAAGNWLSSGTTRHGMSRLAAAALLLATVPISPGRTTWCSSRRKRGTWATSQIRTFRLFFSVVMKLLKYLNRSCTSRLREPATFLIVLVNDKAHRAVGDDHALAGVRSAGGDDFLAVGALGLLHGVEHHAVGHLLFVQEHELLSFTHLFGGHGHQLLRWRRGTGEQLVSGSGTARPVTRYGTEMVEELTSVLCAGKPRR